MTKRLPLTQEQFNLVNLRSHWKINEVPQKHWDKIPGLVRREDTVGVMASGCSTNHRMLNGIYAVAGLDILVYEKNPRFSEPEGNAYHYVVQKIEDHRFPYILHGPFRSKTLVTHWYKYTDLTKYWQEDDSSSSR